VKKYKKSWGKLLQIRLSGNEHEKIINFIKKFGVTRREFILAVINELKHKNLIKNGKFVLSKKKKICKKANSKK
jgi:hypothetical protein